MPGEFLPPVITVLEANIDDVIRKVEEAKALIKTIGGVTVPINFELNKASLARAEAAAKAALGDLSQNIKVNLDGGGLGATAAAASSADNMMRKMYVDTGNVLREIRSVEKASYLSADALNRMSYAMNMDSLAMRKVSADGNGAVTTISAVTKPSLMSAAAMTALNSRMQAFGANSAAAAPGGTAAAVAITAAGAAATRTQGPIASWWATWRNVVHWVVAGGAEILAVGIPALVAMGAYAAVASAGMQNVQAHMQALNTTASATNSMFGQTASSTLGLGNAMQTAQDKVQPQVYELLGSAFNGATGHMGAFSAMGVKMSGVIDQFAAKVNIDLGGAMGHQITGMFAQSTQAATGFGQVLGNVGHIIISLASNMPGLATVLLKTLSGITGALNMLTSQSWSGPLIFLGFALEEAWRWGGMLGRTLGTVVGWLTKGASAAALFGEKIAAASGSSALISASNKTSTAVGNMGTKLGGVANFLKGPWGFAAVSAALGVGYFSYAFLTARSSIQQFADSLQNALKATANVSAPAQMATNVAALGQKTKEAANSATGFKFSWTALGQLIANGRDQFFNAGVAVQQLGSSIKQTQGQQVGFANNAAAIMKQFGVNYPTALALADGANVKLATSTVAFGKNLTLAGQQMLNYERGIQAMGSTNTAFGNDLKALSIQSQLAKTNVSQLNQALDQFAQQVTGGTNAYAQLSTALSGMSNSSQAASANITGGISTISRAATQNTYTLKGWSANAQQSWQQFNAVVSGSGQQLADWFRTAGAMGVMSSGQFTTGMKAMIAQMLPFTQGNKTAMAELSVLAQEAGIKLPTGLKAAEKAMGSSGNASKILRGIIDSVTQKMSSMSTVSQNLGGVLNSQVDSAISGAILKSSGLNKAIETYTNDLVKLGPHNQHTIDALHRMQEAYRRAEAASRAATQGAAGFGNASDTASGKVHKYAVQAKLLADYLHTIPANVNSFVTTTYSSVYTPAGAAANLNPLLHPAGHAAGTSGAAPGWAMVGEKGPELAYFKGGETVIPNSISKRYEGGTTPLGSGGGTTACVHLYLDGQEIHGAVKQANYVYNGDNGNRVRGGGPSGAWTPR